MHILGVAGQPRRYSDTRRISIACDAAPGLNQFMSISAFVLGLAQFIFLVNFFYSLFCGKKAGPQPVAQQHAGMDRPVAAAARQLRDDADRSPRPV